MASSINADNGVVSGTSGLKSTADTSGVLALQSNGTTALTINTDLSATFAGAVTASSFSGTTTTATNLAGGSNGTVPYQSASGTTQMLAAGTSGYFLKSNGAAAPSWAAVPATTPAGSTGQVQYNNAGAFGALASGTSGQVLTSGGSGAAPTWSTLGGSPWVLLSTINASGASTIDIESTFSSDYDYYKIIIPELYQSYASYGMLAVRLKMGGSYQSGANSYNNIYYIVSDGTSFQRVQEYGNWVNIAGNAGVYVGNQSNGKSAVEITVFKPTSTTAFKYCESTVIYPGVGGGQGTPNRVSSAFNYIGTNYGNDSSSTLSGVRIYEYSGGTLTGKAYLYGLKNS